MIECPECKISFSPRHRICPRCGQYEAKPADRIEYLAHTAEAGLDNGATPAMVQAMLLEEGLSRNEADEIISAGAMKVRAAARSYGLKRLLVGLAFLTAASVSGAMGAMGFPSDNGLDLVFAAMLLGLVGVRLIWLGMSGILRGRD